MEQIKKQMDAKLKFCKNEVYSSYDPITQAGLVQYGWKKKLKVDHPVDVSFMSVNCRKNEYTSLKFSNASFAIEPKVCPNKKQIINDGAKVYNILDEKVDNKSKLKEEEKTYKSCDNFPLHGTEAEHSNEGDNYETIKIKEDKFGSKKNKESKRDDKKEIYERYEDLSSDWEEIKEAEYYIKLKEKAARSNLLKGFNPKKDNYKRGYELDDEEEYEEESEEEEKSVDEDISTLFKEDDEK